MSISPATSPRQRRMTTGPGAFHAQWVGPVGLEPTTRRLKGRWMPPTPVSLSVRSRRLYAF